MYKKLCVHNELIYFGYEIFVCFGIKLQSKKKIVEGLIGVFLILEFYKGGSFKNK